MKTTLWIAGLATALVLAIPSWADSTYVMPGGVFGNWTEENSPYVIEGDVRVPADQELRIGPQVTVYFAGHHRFVVEGTLIAAAKGGRKLRLKKPSEETMIRFTTDLEANPAGWGGIRFINSEGSVLENCIIEFARAAGEEADRMGGAVYAENSEVAIANCTIRDNMAAGPGGAIAAVNSELAVTNCSISQNTAGDSGGAVFANGSEMALANISISDNSGGGIRVLHGELAVANCSVSDNRGAQEGGGIHAVSSEISLANASISGNDGGGISLIDESEMVIANSSIHGNRGTVRGGGIFCAGSVLNLTNSSVNDNSPGGIYALDNSQVDLTNCSVRNNAGGEALFRDAGTQVTKSNSSIGE